ncbi:MAG: alpha-L-fucosidase [Bifidobacteriaceae bacterium]|nr:alpha-L-fucosidase [Bifidobacteriaceae bacterium]
MSTLRQVHLDFHNSEAIGVIGDRFDPDEFADTMVKARVNSVNIFAKCLHGFSYYPTAVGTTHPGLSFDLLGEQIKALHARDIKAVAYVSVLWDDLTAKNHPEWVAVDQEGRLLARPALSGESVLEHGGVGWSVLDLASDYPEQVLAQVDEIAAGHRPDGFWFDIVPVLPNYSPAGVARMRAAGVDVSDALAVRGHYLQVRDRFIERTAAKIRHHLPNASIVFNQTTDAWLGRTVPAQNQIDVESLPTDGAWGYLHYPVVARYARTFGPPVVGMTGRFHRSWSDFGGIKTVDQLSYEVGTILSAGGAPSIGDQLDPSGRLDPAVYQTIGAVFERTWSLDPWLAGSEPIVEAAIVAQWEKIDADPGRDLLAPSQGVYGAAQILLERSVLFDVVDADRLEPGHHRLLVVPDDVRLSQAGLAALGRCRAAGAKLLTCGAALPALPCAPATVLGATRTRPSFFRTGGLAPEATDPDFAYACYGTASVIAAGQGATAIGEVAEARFNRSWKHFTSHTYAPVGGEVAGPLLAVKDGWAHLAIPALSDYMREGYWPNAAVVGAVLERLLPDQVLSHDGPPWLEATAHELPGPDGPRATVIHLTAFQPRRLTRGVPRLDSAAAIVGFPIRLRAARPVTRAYFAGDQAPVRWQTLPDAVVELSPEAIQPHTLIVLEHGPSAAHAPA